jgi:hypothetical protein
MKLQRIISVSCKSIVNDSMIKSQSVLTGMKRDSKELGRLSVDKLSLTKNNTLIDKDKP